MITTKSMAAQNPSLNIPSNTSHPVNNNIIKVSREIRNPFLKTVVYKSFMV